MNFRSPDTPSYPIEGRPKKASPDLDPVSGHTLPQGSGDLESWFADVPAGDLTLDQLFPPETTHAEPTGAPSSPLTSSLDPEVPQDGEYYAKGLPQNKVYDSTLSVAARRDLIVPL